LSIRKTRSKNKF
jgi:hypothetical protein